MDSSNTTTQRARKGCEANTEHSNIAKSSTLGGGSSLTQSSLGLFPPK